MAAKGRRAGNPEREQKPISISIGTVGDYFDESEGLPRPVAPVREEPVPVVRDEPAAVPAARRETTVAPARERPPAPPVRPPAQSSPPSKKPGPQPSASPRPKRRRPKADFTITPELEDAAQKLRLQVLARSKEQYVTRADIYKQALFAVARAIDHLNCTRVPERKRYDTASAANYDEALCDAFYEAVGQSYVENHVHQMPERLLRSCYEVYRQRMDEDLETDYRQVGGT